MSRIFLNLEFTTPAVFPYWMGSAFRGGFGQTLRRAVCPDSRKDCLLCETKDKCLFFYTHMKTKSKRGHASPVKPIILIPPFFGKEMRIEKEPRLSVEILFFGDFAKYLPHVILAMSLLGKRGLYSQRYEGLNRFEVKEMGCCFSQKIIYDGETIFLKNLKVLDVRDIDPLEVDRVRIGFRTPFTGKEFPPEPTQLLSGIRNRVIRFVNEYGNGEDIPEIEVDGKVAGSTRHYHKLERRSMRSDKIVFDSYTGIVEYCFEKLDRNGAWVLAHGFHVGCGPDSSFGCGFLRNLG